MVAKEPAWTVHVYVILRYNDRLEEYPDVTRADKLAVKKIVWTREAAEREVERLNKLNGHKGVEYFWLYGRLEKPVTPDEADIKISLDIEDYHGKQ